MAALRLRSIGPVERFPVGRWTIVTEAGREIGVFNDGDRLHAVRNKCPHEGAAVCVQPLTGTMLPSAPGHFEYGMDELVLTCPWHGWQFDVRSGEMIFGTGDRELAVYAVTVSGGEVYLDPTPRRARSAGTPDRSQIGAKG